MGRFDNSNHSSRRITPGTIIFYCFYFLLIAAFVVGMTVGINALKDWLVDFEKSQSTNTSNQVFQELFENPDWKKLYEMTGQEDTIYEGANAYERYMQSLVGDKKLVMAKTSAGLDKTKEKYLILLEKSPIASFTLKNTAAEGEQMPHWELDGVTISFKRQQSVKILTMPGHKVLINGVALDDSHIVGMTTTLAEKYLPEGLHGFRQQVLYLDGLLVTPVVTIQDENGNQVPVQYNADTKMFEETFTAQEMPDEVKTRAIEAAKLYARYTQISNEVSSKTQLQSHFDPNGETYQALPSKWSLWIQDSRGYEFSEPIVSDYYQYSDSLYSVRVNLTITVTRTDGTTKDYSMDTTYFVHLTDGKWLISSGTNEHLQEPITMVKLRYYQDGQLVHEEFVESAATSVTLPTITTPEGKTFLGWFSKEINDKGQTVMHLVFPPSEDGTVYLPEGTVLEPMDLQARFEEDK